MRNPATLLRFILGALALAVGAIGLPVSFALPLAPFLGPRSAMNPLPILVFALIMLTVGTLLWIGAVRSVPDDDVVAGDRGTLLSLMIVIGLLIVLAVVWMLIQPDFWSGFFGGFER